MGLKLGELQKTVLHSVASILEPHGYIFSKNDVPSFHKSDHGVTSYVQFYFKTKSIFVSFSKMLISHQHVEDIIMEIGTPENDYEIQKTGMFFLPTIKDTATLSFDSQNGISTEEEWQKWSDSIQRYLQLDGLKFVDKYKNLMSVLDKLNNLQTEGKYWHELLCGGPEFFFRGLIISKLCRDQLYEEKVNYVDKLFLPNISGDWSLYYEKLKIKLGKM